MIEVASVHVPKTAGTSMRTVLESWYSLVAIHYPEQGLRWDTHFPGDGLPDVVHGHLPASRMPRARTTVAVVREPMERLRSLYAYWQGEPLSRADPHPLHVEVLRGMGFGEFVEHESIRNEQTRYVDSRVDVLLALEDLGNGLPRLAARLDRPMRVLPARNVTPQDKPAASSRVRARVYEVHAEDAALWRAAMRG